MMSEILLMVSMCAVMVSIAKCHSWCDERGTATKLAGTHFRAFGQKFPLELFGEGKKSPVLHRRSHVVALPSGFPPRPHIRRPPPVCPFGRTEQWTVHRTSHPRDRWDKYAEVEEALPYRPWNPDTHDAITSVCYVATRMFGKWRGGTVAVELKIQQQCGDGSLEILFDFFRGNAIEISIMFKFFFSRG